VDNHLLQRVWGEATALLDRSRKIRWLDLLLLVGVGGFIFGVFSLMQSAATYREPLSKPEPLDLGLASLLKCTFYSLARGVFAYFISLGFTLVYGYWAAKDAIAQKVLIPLLDILQSLPVLSFMPGLLLGLVTLFPRSNIGVELACIMMIFTGQAWNMTFSFYQSVRSVPMEMREVATVYRMSWWERFRWVELPYSGMGLVWNSMMSMAGGWFFLTVCESFDLKDHPFRLDGIGAYMGQAKDDENWAAMVYAIVAMTLMIILLDQLVWRPIIVWAQKFRVEEGGATEAMHSWFLDLLRRSHLLGGLSELTQWASRPFGGSKDKKQEDLPPPRRAPKWVKYLAVVPFILLVGALVCGAWFLLELIKEVKGREWLALVGLGLLTLGRVLLATALATLWTVPAGLAIGLSPRLSRVLQPIVQVVASFPVPMLFPLIVLGLNINLNWGSIVLMLLGTQWYILFNVIAGAMAIPADLKEAAKSYNITGWQRFWALYVPAIFPYLVTGWITATGGAWNISIVAEYINLKDQEKVAEGLGALINQMTAANKLAVLTAASLVMSTMVVLFNRLVWRKLYNLADTRFSVNR
jgi:NitT/TauT family transport system permease protein